MRVTVLKDHCDGCVWVQQVAKKQILFCPFIRCVKRYDFTPFPIKKGV